MIEFSADGAVWSDERGVWHSRDCRSYWDGKAWKPASEPDAFIASETRAKEWVRQGKGCERPGCTEAAVVVMSSTLPSLPPFWAVCDHHRAEAEHPPFTKTYWKGDLNPAQVASLTAEGPYGPNSAQVDRFLDLLVALDEAAWATVQADHITTLVSEFVWQSVVYANGEQSRSVGRFSTTSEAAKQAGKLAIEEAAQRHPESYPPVPPRGIGRLRGDAPRKSPLVELGGYDAGSGAVAVAERDILRPYNFAVAYLPFGRAVPLARLDAPSKGDRFGIHHMRADAFLERVRSLTLDNWRSAVTGADENRPTDALNAINDKLMSEGVESPMRRIADEVGLIVLRNIPKPERPGIRGLQGWALANLPPIAAGLISDWYGSPDFAAAYQPFEDLIPIGTLG